MNLNRHPEDPRNLHRNLPAHQRATRITPREGRRGALPPAAMCRTFHCQFCGFTLPDYAITRAAMREMFANPQTTVCRDADCIAAYKAVLRTEI